MQAAQSPKRVAIILLVIVLLPGLFYSGYEINSLSNSEELIEGIYRQQLDAILYSLNQFSWDVASNWASSIAITCREHGDSSTPLERHFAPLFRNTPSISAIVLADSGLSAIRLITPSSKAGSPASLRRDIAETLRGGSEKLGRLVRFRRLEYRKIEPLVVRDSSGAASKILLVFSAQFESGRPAIAGMVLDERSFIRDVLAVKLREVAGDEFIIAVFSGSDNDPVFATETVAPGAVKQKKLLWLFPQYTVGIVLKGTSVQDILQRRFVRSLVLIGLLDAVLIAGVWFVYRSVRSEMELVRMKSDFISNISHELRTPLSLIRMFAETLEMGRLRNKEKIREYYSTILRETERLTRLVNNILNFSRMEAGKRVFRLRPVDVNSIVRNVLETYACQLENAGFSPRVDLADSLPRIKGDEEAISEAIINIVDNAIKYSPGERYIRITTRMRPGGVALEIEDHGIGIRPEHQHKVFETFYRVSDGLVHNTKGSGLGLALVRQIMEGHGGSVELESATEKGSTFRLLFPSVVHHLA